MRDDTQLLLDIIEAIDRIERYSSRGKDAFENDELVQNWIVNHLKVIGEAARSLSVDLKDSNKEISLGKDHWNATRFGSSLFRDRPCFSLVRSGRGSSRMKQRVEAILEER